MKKCLLLTRVSTKYQDFTPQEEDLKKYANDLGYEVAGIISTKESGFRTIDITASEQHIVRTLLQIHHTGHPTGHHHGVTADEQPSAKSEATTLSARERDVLALLVKGYICFRQELCLTSS